MIKKYFARANTADGEVNLIYDNLKGINDIIIISGKSKKAKNRLFTRLAFLLSEKGKDVEGIMNPYDVGAYEGVIVREDGLGIFDRRCAKELKGQEIDLDGYIRGVCEIEDEELLWQKAKWAYDNLYKTYADAKKIHDQWESIYISNMDFGRLNRYTDGVISQLIPCRKSSLAGQRRTGFFGASTPDGSVNYIGGLTENVKNRYFIKGRPGTGKSTFLKKLASVAEQNGYDTQVYYCSFDSCSLDMVIVEELGFAVFDSTPPHELFPSREGDKILDFYTEAGLFGVDEKYERQLEDISSRYAVKIKQGLAYLRLGCCFEAELEACFDGALDEEGICQAADRILREFI